MARPRLRELGGAAAGVEVVARARACRHEAWVVWPDGEDRLADLEDVAGASTGEVSRGDEARARVSGLGAAAGLPGASRSRPLYDARRKAYSRTRSTTLDRFISIRPS